MSQHFTRRRALALAGTVGVGGAGAVGQVDLGDTGHRPNVIVVMTDDQGYADMSCHGHPVLETPNIDQLRDEGAHFADFHTGTICAPTRAGLLTGQHNLRCGVGRTYSMENYLRRDHPTMADIFREAGYRTAVVGKWHLGDSFPYRPTDRGFHHSITHGGGGIGQVPDYWGNDQFGDTYFVRADRTRSYQGYCTDVWFDEAIDFVERNRNRPFFLYLTPNSPHKPHEAPEEDTARFDDVPEPLRDFYGEIENVDKNLWRLVERLDELGIGEDTILVFLTDNGSFHSAVYNAGMRGGKGSPYEGGHRSACFLRWPGRIRPYTNVEALSTQYDLLPTLLDLADLGDPGIDFDGLSHAAELQGGAPVTRGHPVHISWQLNPETRWARVATLTDRWRLVNGTELYDVKLDPGQENDVSDRRPGLVEELRGEYETWWSDVTDRYTGPARITAGGGERRVDLTAHDWLSQPLIPQDRVLEGVPRNGRWPLRVERAGAYRVLLRRWPGELGLPITDAPPGGTAVDAATARIRITGNTTRERSAPIGGDDAAVAFDVALDAGNHALRTWIGDSRGAYYASIRSLQ
jgi:arylsulfatase A-like enzyme